MGRLASPQLGVSKPKGECFEGWRNQSNTQVIAEKMVKNREKFVKIRQNSTKFDKMMQKVPLLRRFLTLPASLCARKT